jgi:hypothetical protein
LADTAWAIAIVSDRPAPVLIERAWFAPPAVTAARLTPPGPIVTRSGPAPPTTDRPAKLERTFRSTVIRSLAESIVTPAIGADDVIVPALRAAVIFSDRLAAS